MGIKSLIIIALILFIGIFIFTRLDSTEYIKSNVDGKYYLVRSHFKNKQEVADSLSNISDQLHELVKYMYDNKLPDNERCRILFNRFKNTQIREMGALENATAFTVNKGDEIHICARNEKNNNELETYNTMMFVALKEFAHIMSDSYGHGDEFKCNFQILIYLASCLGIYTPQNFGRNPENYCGTKIVSTPYMFDSDQHKICNEIKNGNFTCII